MERLCFLFIHLLLLRGFLGAANFKILSKIEQIRFMGLSATLGKYMRPLLAVDDMSVGRLYVVMLHNGLYI